MTLSRARLRLLTLPLLAIGVAGVAGGYFALRDSGDPRLAGFVTAGLDYPVVFTSRSEPMSFRAASSRGDYAVGGAALSGTGQPQWQAREGRLRVLTTGGRVREMTWGKPLPDGGTLIDVMSPSVSPDAAAVVFAGRQAGGRFRIYAVDLDGSDLRQLTGTADDPGCVAVPPLRFGPNGERLADAERQRFDYDDIDPTLLPDGTIFFASSRTPDLGGRDRRATQLWRREPGQPPRQHTASRANDRWPAVTPNRSLLFTLWSRQNEVVSADGTGLVRHDPPAAGLTAPADRWAGVTVTASSESFGQAVKVTPPVWRVRALFGPNLAFMTPAPGQPTPFTPANESPEGGPLRVGQSKYGQVSSAPSSLAADGVYPTLAEPPVLYAPATTADGRRWSLATPSPIPGGRLLVAAAPLAPDGRPELPRYGLYTVPQDGWTADLGATGDLAPLFDDPDLIDAEPVAAYRRAVPDGKITPPRSWDPLTPKSVGVVGKPYAGPAGELHVEQLATPATGQFAGQRADGAETGPVVPHFKPGAIRRIDFYAAHRDRFDDPVLPVVRGTLEKLLEAPTTPDGNGSATLRAVLPVGSPTLLVGVGADGKVVSATGAADAAGHRGKFYAFAGDHVSGTRAGGYHFCSGCHTGHTAANPVPERLK